MNIRNWMSSFQTQRKSDDRRRTKNLKRLGHLQEPQNRFRAIRVPSAKKIVTGATRAASAATAALMVRSALAQPQLGGRRECKTISLFQPSFNPNFFNVNLCQAEPVVMQAYQQCANDATLRGGYVDGPVIFTGPSGGGNGPLGAVQCNFLCCQVFPIARPSF